MTISRNRSRSSNSKIHWKDNNCFEIDIGPQMLKSKMASIKVYDDDIMTIRFTDGSWITVTYPKNQGNLANEIESGLLQYKGWKREKLSPHRIKKIMNYVMENLETIRQAIIIQNKNTK